MRPSVTANPHVAKADAYVADVLAGREPACKWVKKACQRHLDDLARSRRVPRSGIIPTYQKTSEMVA